MTEEKIESTVGDELMGEIVSEVIDGGDVGGDVGGDIGGDIGDELIDGGIDEAIKEIVDEIGNENLEDAQSQEAVTCLSPAKSMVYVCYCSPQGLKLKIKDEDIVLNGAKVSDLVTHQGAAIRSGTFGVTVLDREKWAAITAIYGKTKLFKSGRILAVNSMDDVKAVSTERKTLRHGREQIDPSKSGVKKFKEE